jgi:hypothetical protein
MNYLPNGNLETKILPNIPLPKGGVIIPSFPKGKCGKIAKNHQVGQGHRRSFTAAPF